MLCLIHFQFFTTAIVQVMVCWVLTPCSLVEEFRLFERILFPIYFNVEIECSPKNLKIEAVCFSEASERLHVVKV
jgi:hypothetical protein